MKRTLLITCLLGLRAGFCWGQIDSSRLSKIERQLDTINLKLTKLEAKLFPKISTYNFTNDSNKAKLDLIKEHLKNKEQNYNCVTDNSEIKATIVSNLTFDNLITPFFTKAAANIDGVVKNGKVFSYSVDNDKSTIGINHLFTSEKYKSNLISVNINGTSVGSFLNIVNNAKYNYGIEGSVKLSTRVSSSIFFDGNKCTSLKTQREYNNSLILARYKNLLRTDTGEMNKTLNRLKESIKIDSIVYENNIFHKNYKSISDSIKLLNDSLDLIRQIKFTNGKVYEKIDKEIAKYEFENVDINGYSIHWIDKGIGYKLLSNSIFNDTIFKLNKIGQKQFHRVSCTISYNYLKNVKRGLFYFNVGFSTYNRYALESQKVKDFDFTDTLGITTSFKGYDVKKGQNININSIAFNPFFTILCYPGENSSFGLELSTNGIYDKNTTNIIDGRFGVIYSITDKDEEKLSRTTIGLFFLLNKYDVSVPQLEKYTGVGIRVGVPLANLFKEKK